MKNFTNDGTFTPQELEYNEKGLLAKTQIDRLQNTARNEIRQQMLWGISVAVLWYGMLFIVSFFDPSLKKTFHELSDNPFSYWMFVFILLIMPGLTALLAGIWGVKKTKELSMQVQVLSVSGKAVKKEIYSNDGLGPLYMIKINTVSFSVQENFFNQIIEDWIYTVYYIPQLAWNTVLSWKKR